MHFVNRADRYSVRRLAMFACPNENDAMDTMLEIAQRADSFMFEPLPVQGSMH
jgi:hypothetical protein